MVTEARVTNLDKESVMDNNELNQLFDGYPNVINGVKNMKQQWEISGRKVDSKSKLSVQFHVKNAEDGHVAFRVARATKKKPPEVVIFSGKNSSNRGSPLLKRVIEKDKQKLKDLGFKDDKPGWRKLLSKNTEPDFYTNFVEHALKMVR